MLRALPRLALLIGLAAVVAGCADYATHPDLTGRWTVQQHCSPQLVGDAFMFDQHPDHSFTAVGPLGADWEGFVEDLTTGRVEMSTETPVPMQCAGDFHEDILHFTCNGACPVALYRDSVWAD